MQHDLRTPLALSILALLRVQAMHPYEMKRLMREWSIDEIVRLRGGSLYSTINRLMAAGLIAIVDVRREGRRPERSTYRLTGAGRAHLAEWMRDLIVEPVDEYPWFGSVVVFATLLTADEFRDLFVERAARLATQVVGEDFPERTTATGEAIPRAFQLGHEYAHAMRRAELGWVRQVIDDIDEGRFVWPDIVRTWQDLDPDQQEEFRLPLMDPNESESECDDPGGPKS